MSVLSPEFKLGSHVMSGQKYYLHDGFTSNNINQNDLSFHNIVFSHHEHGEVGRLSWADGLVTFQGNLDQSAEKFAEKLQDHTNKYLKKTLEPYGDQARLLAAVLGLLGPEQMQQEPAQQALNFLHDLEYFERRIAGEL